VTPSVFGHKAIHMGGFKLPSKFNVRGNAIGFAERQMQFLIVACCSTIILLTAKRPKAKRKRTFPRNILATVR